jgi:tRNA pseudouridine55 synthase
MQGMLLVDKPADWTSFDVVNKVRRLIATAEDKKPKNVKVGHAGTLDPFATGLLILFIGKEYTKRAGEFSKLDKTYELTLEFGKNSTTGDPEGEITPVNDVRPSLEELETILEKFTGKIEQIPPAYSAIKIDGQRAYKLARAGKEVVIEPRKVTIHRLELVDYSYPFAKLVVDVSSGTYIRSLVEDIGKALDIGAYTKELRRTKIDKFDVGKAISVTELDSALVEQRLFTNP